MFVSFDFQRPMIDFRFLFNVILAYRLSSNFSRFFIFFFFCILCNWEKHRKIVIINKDRRKCFDRRTFEIHFVGQIITIIDQMINDEMSENNNFIFFFLHFLRYDLVLTEIEYLKRSAGQVRMILFRDYYIFS